MPQRSFESVFSFKLTGTIFYIFVKYFGKHFLIVSYTCKNLQLFGILAEKKVYISYKNACSKIFIKEGKEGTIIFYIFHSLKFINIFKVVMYTGFIAKIIN